MKKILFLMLTFLIWSAASMNAQVTIGSTNDPVAGSVLDLDVDNLGFKLPRVALQGESKADPLPAHVAGMMVYNTAFFLDDSNVLRGPGIYYNDGIRWIASNTNVIPDNSDSNNIYIATQPKAFSWAGEWGQKTVTLSVEGYYNSIGTPTYEWHEVTEATDNVVGTDKTLTLDYSDPESLYDNLGLHTFYCLVKQGTKSDRSNNAEVVVGCGAKNTSNKWVTFMCYNLGADEQMTVEESMKYQHKDFQDETVQGWAFQYNRAADGHQRRTDASEKVLGPVDVDPVTGQPDTDKFIYIPGDNTCALDWRNYSGTSTHVNAANSWRWEYYNEGQLVKNPSSPCPDGWALPTVDDVSLVGTWKYNTVGNNSGPACAYGSETTLYMPNVSQRQPDGDYNTEYEYIRWWVSSEPGDGCAIALTSDEREDLRVPAIYTANKPHGRVVRCVKK
jgi:hypothetical protein